MDPKPTTAASTQAPQGVKPTVDQTAKMASDMLNSAVSQKDSIASSFEAQRAEVLRSVEQLKNQHVAPKNPGNAAGSGSPTEAGGNEMPPPTPEELAILRQIMQTPQPASPESGDAVMQEIVAIIRQLISVEVARQLAAAKR